jgi:hypothetical protein
MDPVASADSVTVDPPALGNIGQCAAANSQVMEFSGGKTPALVCHSLGTQTNDVPGTCPRPDQVCTYPNLPGFSICLLWDDMTPCPEGWPTRHLVFEKSAACACSCGFPTGESCAVTVSAYADGACANPLGSVMAASDQPAACFDVAPGSALGSKAAVVNYTPGTCPPKLQLTQSVTFCCLP